MLLIQKGPFRMVFAATRRKGLFVKKGVNN